MGGSLASLTPRSWRESPADSTPGWDRALARRWRRPRRAAPLMVVMHGTRYVTALRRMAFSSWNAGAPVVV